MSDPKTWRTEYEKLVIEEALRRMRRQPPRDVRTWAIASRMSRFDRVVVALLAAASRVGKTLRRIIRP
jgi:hypothetical protein